MNYDDNNQGVLFQNKRKEPGSRQPDLDGHIKIDRDLMESFLTGNSYTIKLVGWNKDTKIGPVVSIKVKKEHKGGDQKKSYSHPQDLDDDVPF